MQTTESIVCVTTDNVVNNNFKSPERKCALDFFDANISLYKALRL